jgi:hypothetical protein
MLEESPVLDRDDRANEMRGDFRKRHLDPVLTGQREYGTISRVENDIGLRHRV